MVLQFSRTIFGLISVLSRALFDAFVFATMKYNFVDRSLLHDFARVAAILIMLVVIFVWLQLSGGRLPA